MKKITTLLFLMLIGINFNVHAQLTGSKSIPGTYATIAAAIADLNVQGVGSGGVTFNVQAGYTETATELVIKINANVPTAANQVVFQRFGAGPNPLITAAPGDSLHNDGIIKLLGADYITFDAIDLLDPASNTGVEMTEWGYALLRATTRDGSQHNVIRNCNITLQKINLRAYGIHILNKDSAGTVIVAEDNDGLNSYNRFYGNTITNIYKGIVTIGASLSRDIDNEIGVNGQTPNTITNWGGLTGGDSVSAQGIRAEGQINIKINNNVINGGSGTGGSAATVGIIATLFGASASAPNYEISYNVVTVQSSPSSQATYGIRALATADTIWMHHNIVENCLPTQNTLSFNALVHDPTGDTRAAYIYNNIVRNNSHSGTGASTLIGASGTIRYLSLHANQVYGNQKTGISGTMNCISAEDTLVECDSNLVYNNSIPFSSGTGSSNVYGYINNGSPGSEKVFNNTFYNLTVGGSNTSTSSLVVGIRSNAAATTNKDFYGNLIYGLSGVSGASTTGGVYGIYSTLSLTAKIHNNKIYNLTNVRANGTTGGIWVSSGFGIEIYDNFIYDLKAPSSTVANAVMGITSTSTTANSTISIRNNSINLNASGGTTFGSSGISVNGNTTATTAAVELLNNTIINLSTPGSTSGNTVAYRRSNVNLANYALTSDFNNFYAGTPAANRLIFFDGTNSDQLLANYKIRVAPRDANSTSSAQKTLNLAMHHEAFNITDTIIVELRSTVSPYNLIETATGLGGGGIKHQFHFASAVDGVPYYIVVRHRNSIETWSKSGGEVFTNGVLLYDFTTAASQAFLSNQVLVGSDYSIYTGDVDQNDVVNLTDIIIISNAVTNFVTGYVVSDLNYNNVVNLTDLIYAYNNATLFVATKRP